MANSRPTIEDVARAAGVSLMTVSRAMNGRPGVGAKTRRRILAIAKRMGYRPNRLARGLASRRTSAVGIVLPDMANPFFAILAKAATDVARNRSVNVFVINTDEEPARELSAYDSLIDERIDGVVVAASRLPASKLRAAVAHFAIPVLVNSLVRGEGIFNVDVDDRCGMRDAVAHLVARGRRRIAFVAGPRASGSSRRRLSGYRAGLVRGGIPWDPRLVVRAVPDIEGGERATASLLAVEPRIDAVLAHNDITAIGVLRGLVQAGVSVPADVAVMGVDDIPYAALVHPSLSTLRVDIAALGRTTMNLLLAMRDGEDFGVIPPIRPELVIRESSG